MKVVYTTTLNNSNNIVSRTSNEVSIKELHWRNIQIQQYLNQNNN